MLNDGTAVSTEINDGAAVGTGNLDKGTPNADATSTEQAARSGQVSEQGTEQKTYSQEDFDRALQSETDRRVRQALESAKAKWRTEAAETIKSERDEAARLAKMSADERARALFDKQRADFDAERKQYAADKLEFETTKQLAEQGLPVAFAKLLCGTDAETTKSNIESFKTEYAKAIEAAVTDRLKSAPPRVTDNAQAADPFLKGFNA